MPDMDTATLEALLAEATPGPWRLGSWQDSVFGTGPKGEWLPICRVKRDDAPIEESRDRLDAALIALAPDLARKVIAQAAQIKRLRAAAEALGALPEGYCFCSKHRIGDDSKIHEPECADLRAALQSEVSHG